MFAHETLVYAFACLLATSVFIYAVLDGFDLGVGMLLLGASDSEKDTMISSIGPFWDANETWLVLAVGILLVAFPHAHGEILSALYAPITLMVLGLIFRGVAFDFRMKVPARQKSIWNYGFFLGSYLACLAQGYMIGVYVLGLASTAPAMIFGLMAGFALSGFYSMIGACWLIIKCEGLLQHKAVAWARESLQVCGCALLAITVLTPLISPSIFLQWFQDGPLMTLLPFPVFAMMLLSCLAAFLNDDKQVCVSSKLPFILAICIFVMFYAGFLQALQSQIIPGRMDMIAAASAPEALEVMLWGFIALIPFLLIYHVIAYQVFSGKVKELTYD